MEHVTLSQLLSATDGRAVDFDDTSAGFNSIALDSRNVRLGDLFWAVQGEQHDGHAFVAAAFDNGAAAAVVRNDYENELRVPVVTVPDTLIALWDFAKSYREAREALIVGVTGSFGKTTTRSLIHSMLETQFAGMQSPRNFNNHFGVPLSLLEIQDDDEFAVLEFGASDVGEIRQLAELAEPEIGIITGIGPAHLCGFGSEQRILSAKSELLESLPSNGLAILAGDDQRLCQLAEQIDCRTILVGEGSQNDIRATRVNVGRNRLSFQVDSDQFELQVTGRHYLTAALCAVAVGREVGIDSKQIANGLASFTTPPGRCQLQSIGPWTVIDDTYNSNPASMQAALEVLRDWQTAGRKLLVVGDMLELGERSAAFHRQLGADAATAGIDCLLAHGQQAEQVIWGAAEEGMNKYRMAECEDFDAMLAVLNCWLEPGDVILVKGSRGMQMERVIERLQQRVAWKTDSPPLRAVA
ncbi:MAG: UDP-N-acetylmuramoyl-tripeptide--D-alanyl-D-alanine ligase [Planctomycetaceae bacterium]|jgi:UDP-N-acetylmuramoyl-tripeptide--D-alanyl-D-alanine ligase|nr:UDP-N-acetylmuramoyl-tripeptide--D-alanyl-D-alanine ligase [Planctomycetaceae bacterium]MBT6156238.1 UDP-N-acetylmuramoyl-tripeptide--D-alanyl-D-alanine ligase [Planctomycetaceae bacterium]MBT6487894.1 UDP-N-acetylmuramoyl-tripeptide--D-alanyl-D-alanine ligase [Planctomycetaceae bacterium]MBT6493482.1 UDP-N-acetylmuramoyl-tripeptide--D-alanyl-D-alanine ligase [Planctomycetaceae bacterium]